jgi:hypothetical protein
MVEHLASSLSSCGLDCSHAGDTSMLSRGKAMTPEALKRVLDAADSPHFRKMCSVMATARREMETRRCSGASASAAAANSGEGGGGGGGELNVGHDMPFAKGLFKLLDDRGFLGWSDGKGMAGEGAGSVRNPIFRAQVLHFLVAGSFP